MLPTARKFRGTVTVKRKARLEGGLVPARKNPPRIRRLELAGEQALGALIGRVIDEEEAAVEFVDPRGELDAQPVRTDGKRLRKGERRGLGGGIERNVGSRRAVVDDDGSERRIDGIERQPRGGLAHLDVDDLHAGKHEICGVGLQLDRIVDAERPSSATFPASQPKEKTGSAQAAPEIERVGAARKRQRERCSKPSKRLRYRDQVHAKLLRHFAGRGIIVCFRCPGHRQSARDRSRRTEKGPRLKWAVTTQMPPPGKPRVQRWCGPRRKKMSTDVHKV